MDVETAIHDEALTRATFEDWALGIERCVAARKTVQIITKAIRNKLLAEGAVGRTDLINNGIYVELPALIAAPVGAFAVANGEDPNTAEFDPFILNSIHRQTDGLVFVHSGVKQPNGQWFVRVFIT